MRTLIVSAIATSLLLAAPVYAADKGLRSDSGLKSDTALTGDASVVARTGAQQTNALQDAIDRDRKAIKAATEKMQANRKARVGKEALKADREALQDAKNLLKLDQTACTQAYSKALAASSGDKNAPAPIPCK